MMRRPAPGRIVGMDEQSSYDEWRTIRAYQCSVSPRLLATWDDIGGHYLDGLHLLDTWLLVMQLSFNPERSATWDYRAKVAERILPSKGRRL
jgi:hypothetical protein